MKEFAICFGSVLLAIVVTTMIGGICYLLSSLNKKPEMNENPFEESDEANF